MGRVKEQLLDREVAGEVFGNLTKYLLATDEEHLEVGATVTIVNKNCEFSFDNVRGCFEDNLLHYFLVDLELLGADYSNYETSKSNNGGAYAFAECKVKKVYKKSY